MSVGPFPMVAVARPVVEETECWEDDLVIPMDSGPLLSLLLPLSGVLLVYLSALAYSVFASSPSPQLEGLSLGRSEEGVERLSKADRQADQRDEGDVERARLDLLQVLPVHVAPLGSLLQGPISGMAQSSDPSAKSSLLLLEAGGGSVGLGRSLWLGGGHAFRPSAVRLAVNTSHVTTFS